MSREKVEAVVKALDANGDGHMDPAEVRVFVAKLTGLAVDEIPLDHPEVRQ